MAAPHSSIGQEASAQRSTERLPPGPKGRRLSNMRERLRDFPGFLERLNREHGDVVSYQLPSMTCCAVFDADLIREMLVDKRSFFPKSEVFEINNKFITQPGVFTSEGDDHRRRRKLVAPAFSQEYLDVYAEIMVENALMLQERWSAGQIIDANEEAYRVARRVAFGAFFGRDRQGDQDVGDQAVRGLKWDIALGFLPFTSLLRKLPVPGNTRAERACKALDKIIFEAIRRARNSSRNAGSGQLGLRGRYLGLPQSQGAGVRSGSLVRLPLLELPVLGAGNVGFFLHLQELELLYRYAGARLFYLVSVVRAFNAEERLSFAHPSTALEHRRYPTHPAADLRGDVDFGAGPHGSGSADRNCALAGRDWRRDCERNLRGWRPALRLGPTGDHQSGQGNRPDQDDGGNEPASSSTHVLALYSVGSSGSADADAICGVSIGPEAVQAPPRAR